MKFLFSFFTIILFVTSTEKSFANLESRSWQSKVLYGKYLPKGEGWEIVGEISALIDTETNETLAYHYYRETRSYFIMANNKQPYIEAWDFPNNCPNRACADSKMARVTFLPYAGNEFLGSIQWEIEELQGLFLFRVNNQILLTVNLETMQVMGGIIQEDSAVPPKELHDPHVQCAKNLTCVRSLAFGKLAHQNIAANYSSSIQWSDAPSINAPNNQLYNPQVPHRSGFLFSTEDALRNALQKIL